MSLGSWRTVGDRPSSYAAWGEMLSFTRIVQTIGASCYRMTAWESRSLPVLGSVELCPKSSGAMRSQMP